ncbi:diguanylate cyclase domain-containing protein [Solibacillus silvestris]|uniref:diguanylate cyclase domain-containing protein n=1 Tax=Solibacillus silvestris TaxID=76853 RepID=UPI003F80E719
MERVEELEKTLEGLLQKSHYQDFFVLIDPAIKICEMHGAKKQLINLLIFKANAYIRTGQVQSGFELLTSQAVFINKYGTIMQILNFKNVRSSLLIAAGYYESAVESLLEMIPLAEQLDHINLLTEISNNLCYSYLSLGNYEPALQYAEQSIKYLNKHKRKYRFPSSLTMSVQNNLANIYLHYNRLEEVEELIRILSESNKKNSNRRHHLNLQIIIAKFFAKKGEYSVAIKMLEKLQRKLVDTEDLALLKDVQKNLIKYSKQIGDEQLIIQKQQMFIKTLLLQQKKNVLQQAMHMEYTMRKTEVFDSTNRDALTNLYNRRYMEVQSGKLLETVPDNRFIAYLVFDIDYFKHINDEHGHLVGDEVLKILAAEVQLFIKDTPAIFSRYGGDEFVMFLHAGTPGELEDFTKQFHEFSRSLHFEANNLLYPISISIGLSMERKKDIKNLEQLFHEADQALYESKNNGRNQFTIFT